MKEENRKYAEEAYEIVNDAAHKIGSRLPGSEGESKFHDYMGEKLKAIGINPVKEEFAVSPRSGIGGLGYAGWAGFIISLGAYLALAIPQLWIPLGVFAFLAVFWLIFACFFYKTWFDMFFPQKISQNSYGILEPEDGNVEYNIILSGHTDTSWCWRHSEHAYKYKDKPIIGIIATYGKVGFGAVCFFAMAIATMFMCVIAIGQVFDASWAQALLMTKFYQVFKTIMYLLPAVAAIGCWFVIIRVSRFHTKLLSTSRKTPTSCPRTAELSTST